MKKKLGKLIKRAKKHIPMPQEVAPLADEPVPRITNETVAEYREEVLSSARKYIYPLQHSKHKIVIITTSLVTIALVTFFTYCGLALYKFKSYSGLLYGVTQVIPFPVAKAGSSFVAYENYFFELRHYIHYYETQQKLDFDSEAGKQQLAEYKKRALDNILRNAYVKQLASKNKISVSDSEVEDTITILRNQNRLGASDRGFEDVLKENFGWSLNDFKRSLKQQLLAQKVVAALDTDTWSRAKAALAELNNGADFGVTAKKYSDDASTRDNGGEFGFLIDKSNRDVSAYTTSALFRLKPGETSGIINTGFGLEIVKAIEVQGDKIKASHIAFTFKDIIVYVNEQKDKNKPKVFIKL